MSQRPTEEFRFLVVVSSGDSADRATEYALREARDLRAESGVPVSVDVRIVTPLGSEAASRIEAVVAAFDPGRELDTSVESIDISGEGPQAVTDSLVRYAEHRTVSHLLLDVGLDASVERLREEFGVMTVEVVPADEAPDRKRLVYPGGVRQTGLIFAVTFLFYQAIGGFVGGLDLLTGALSAGIVAVALSGVALSEAPTLRRTGARVVRTVAFLPALLWEIVKANFVVAYIILHPRLPIDPSLDVVETDTSEDMERMVLANSITLTPGTVTVDVQGREFTIHSLTGGSRTGLPGGRLQRLVSWVFYGSRRERSADDSGGESR